MEETILDERAGEPKQGNLSKFNNFFPWTHEIIIQTDDEAKFKLVKTPYVEPHG